MTSVYLWGGGLAIIALALWFAMRTARREGEAQQRAKDLEVQRDAEHDIHEVQLQDRSTPETIKRLEDGGF